ncbi:hypothetical protein C8J57DRAFT_1438765 [Mycena rebaudengoi]|nr:hypothetical protein C8J57DRAFT_1438765 [Mycena rebaudengoi]
MSRHGSRSSSAPIITLYDLKSASPQPWAPNIWRISDLRYRTVWVEFPDVEATLRAIGAPASAVRSDGRPIYTLPVVAPHILANTNNIAEYLEAAYPARPVFPEGTRALQSLFVHYIQEIFVKPLLPIMVPLSHQSLPERSHGGGPSSPQVVSDASCRPSSVNRRGAQVKEQFDFLSMILDKNVGDGDGMVACGHEVSYADFALCSVLIWIQRMAAQDGWMRIREWNGGRWARLWERCKAYMDEY